MKKSGSNEFNFETDINGVSSRPYNTDFEGTSYAYRHKNSLFISLDIFLTVNNGAENYFDREMDMEEKELLHAHYKEIICSGLRMF